MKVRIPDECAEPSRNEKIVCAENRCKITFINRARRKVVKYRIDGCRLLRDLLENPGCKLCDYLVAVESRGEEHYVELKGKHVQDALDQLASTIRQLKSSSPRSSVYCWVIATESPRESSKFQVLRRKFEREFSARVKIRTSQCEHVLAANGGVN
jgi:hypothetical protein